MALASLILARASSMSTLPKPLTSSDLDSWPRRYAWETFSSDLLSFRIMLLDRPHPSGISRHLMARVKKPSILPCSTSTAT